MRPVSRWRLKSPGPVHAALKCPSSGRPLCRCPWEIKYNNELNNNIHQSNPEPFFCTKEQCCQLRWGCGVSICTFVRFKALYISSSQGIFNQYFQHIEETFVVQHRLICPAIVSKWTKDTPGAVSFTWTESHDWRNLASRESQPNNTLAVILQRWDRLHTFAEFVLGVKTISGRLCENAYNYIMEYLLSRCSAFIKEGSFVLRMIETIKRLWPLR